MTDTPDIAALARYAGLDLPEPYQAELANAWQHVAAMIASIHRDWSYAEEPAHVFNPITFDKRG